MHGADKETEASKGDPPGIAHCRLTAELAVTRVVWVSAGKGVHALFSSLNLEQILVRLSPQREVVITSLK